MNAARTVAEEIGQSVPFKSRSQEALVSLLRTADEVKRFLSRALCEEDVTLQQYNVLRILRGAGPGGLPTLEVARRMIEQQPGVTRLIDRLIRKDLVQRRRGIEDRRKVVCSITDEGLRLLSRLDEKIDESDEQVVAALDPDDLARMIDLLDELRAGIRKDDPGEECGEEADEDSEGDSDEGPDGSPSGSRGTGSPRD